MPICYPEHPSLASEAERDVWRQLVRDLPATAHMLANWRRTDATGQHETDIIVAWPGHGMFLIEVKGGLVSVDADGQWWSRDRHGEQHPIDPFDQALRNSHAVSDFIDGRWSSHPLHLTWLVVLPHTDLPAAFQTAKASREYIVDRGELPTLVDRLQVLGRREHGTNHSGERCALLVRHLADIRDPQRALIDDGADRERLVQQLTDEQREKLDEMELNERFAIIGPAGSGKTYLALEQMRRRTRLGERVAFLCYSYGLARVVGLAAEHWPEDERPAFVGTFHLLGAMWGVTPPPSAPGAWWTDDCAPLMLAEAQGLADHERFDAVVVDEGQDFKASWWTVVQASLRDPAHGGLFVFGDPDQNVFDRDEIKALGLPTARLLRNMRNARPIAELASALSSNTSAHLGLDGPAVGFEQCEPARAHAVAEDVLEWLFDRGWDPRDIALLSTKHQPSVQKEYSGGDSEEEIVRRKAEYWELFFDEKKAVDVFYGTVTGFKGLERRVVVLAVDGFGSQGRARETLYAGMTRARDLLIICGDREQLREVGGDEFAALLPRDR